jgi:hypothetical protein
MIALGLVLAACARHAYVAREPWRGDLERRCLSSGAVQMSDHVRRVGSINGPNGCGMDYPLRVSAQMRGAVSYSQPQTLACQMVPTADRWIGNVVQPAAQKWFGATVVEVRAGSYSCRGIRGSRSGRMSEHSFGNALDVFAFQLSNGHTVSVRTHWRGDGPDAAFLREVFIRACDHFTTVLGPGSDAFHYDHFHLDLARHDAQFTRRICRPRPETVQMPNAVPAGGSGLGWGLGRTLFSR